ncbi:MAG: winged helix DNA-binding protein [Alphaproteobacteria bacterium]|nr:winged helix DNA-binding protein [Alphaproteobacteria bacterium]
MARLTESDIRLSTKILTWIGIIDQLSTTRITRALAPLKLPYPQFVLLVHFSHRPEEPQTVMRVASAMQQPQPGITKTIQKMLTKKLLRAVAAPDDARSKLLYLTPKGVETHGKAISALVPVFREMFEPWSEADINDLIEKLDRLKVWLDTKGRK